MKKQLFEWMQFHEEAFSHMAKQIWDNPQLGYEETFASRLQQDFLNKEGFDIVTPIGDVQTAFYAQWGSGSPIIGFLGEFDALPGLSQQVSPQYLPVKEGAPGHGCGHNLLGTAGVEAVVALKEIMTHNNIQGTIRYYGCPAEELLSGKSYMARAGVFDDLDIVYTWHPFSFNMTANFSMQALTAIEFYFSGRTAHAAGAPHLGRSALDAVELTSVGANYLREHVPDGSRIHYQITNGGLAPNIVPDRASVYYFLRGTNRDAVKDLERRLIKVAKGAAMMTETEVHWELKAGCYDTLPNLTLNEQMLAQWNELPPLSFTEDEHTFAKSLQASLDPSVLAGTAQQSFVPNELSNELLVKRVFHFPQTFRQSMQGSSDLGDVSWIAPLGQVFTTCAPYGVQVHTWQATAAFGSSLGMKGMHYAAKAMAGAALDSLLDPEIIKKAKEEFVNLRAGKHYECDIPEEVKAPNKGLG